MTFRAFTSYTGNIKEFSRNVPLGPLTLITGEENSHKSSIAIGARLALSGSYDPVGKLPSELLKLSCDRSLGVQAILQGPDGDAEWNLYVGEDGKAKKPSSPTFTGKLSSLTEDERYCIIPTDSVRDLLKSAKGERKLREALIRRFGGTLSSVPEPEFDEASLKVWREAVKHCSQSLDSDASADSLLASLSEYFRLEASRLSREKKPLENYISTKKKILRESEILGGTSPELLPDLEKKLDIVKTWMSLREQKVNAVSRINALQDMLSELKEPETNWMEETTQKLTSLKNELNILEANQIDLIGRTAVARYLAGQYRTKLEEGNTKCLLCSNDKVNVEQTLHYFEKKEEQRSKEKDECRALIKQKKNEIDHLVSLITSAQEQSQQESFHYFVNKKNLETELTNRRVELDEIDNKLSKLPAIMPKQTILELETQIATIKSSLSAKTELARESTKLVEIDARYTILKRCETEAIEFQKILMKRVAQTASDEVSIGMLDGRRALLDPATCEWSIVRKDGEAFPFSTACGTERTSLMLGLAAAWTRGSPLRVAIFDDEDMVGLSTKGIQDFYATCEALYDRGDFTQIIVVNNRPELAPTSRWLTIVRAQVI